MKLDIIAQINVLKESVKQITNKNILFILFLKLECFMNEELKKF